MVQIARVGGFIINVVTGWSEYKRLREVGYTASRAGQRVLVGYDNTEIDPLEAIPGNLLDTYWPSLGGELIHQAFGNPKGFFNSGVGMKLNASTPKGWNI